MPDNSMFTPLSPEERAVAEAPPKRRDGPTAAQKAEIAKRLWQEAAPLPLLDRYLCETRGIPRPPDGWPDHVRLHPTLPFSFHVGQHRPAMLMPKTDADGNITGLHAVFLDSEGKKAAVAAPKKSFGPAGVVVFRSDGELLLACEGPEDALSLLVAMPEAAVICTAGAGTLKRVADHLPAETRRVVLMADRDDAGREGAEAAARAVTEAGLPVAIAVPPEGVKDANELLRRDGIEGVQAAILAASPWHPAPDDGETGTPAGSRRRAREWPFRATADGIEKRMERTDPDSGETRVEWRWFCSPLEIVADTRDADGEAWGRMLRIIDRDGRAKAWAMPMSMLAGDGAVYRERLLSLGLILAPARFARDALHELISTSQPGAKARCVHRVGWHTGHFIKTETEEGDHG